MQRRRVTVRNPLKSLAARLDLQEYTEVKTGVAQKELKRIKLEKGWGVGSTLVSKLNVNYYYYY